MTPLWQSIIALLDYPDSACLSCYLNRILPFLSAQEQASLLCICNDCRCDYIAVRQGTELSQPKCGTADGGFEEAQ